MIQDLIVRAVRQVGLILLAGLAGFCCCGWWNPAPVAGAEPPEARVLLAREATAEVTAIAGGYQLIDEAKGTVVAKVAPNEGWRVTATGREIKVTRNGQVLTGTYAGSLCFQADQPENIFGLNGKKYRGSLRVDPSPTSGENKLLLINQLDLESYLAGVVGMEMGFKAPAEALKAQVVASRSYALYQRENNRLLGQDYDLRCDQYSQVYTGVAGEQPQIWQAVQATRGEVAVWDGEVINAVFHSNAGGRTEDSEYVWTANLPYLRGVASPEDQVAAEQKGTATAYHWQKTLAPAGLAERVRSLTGKDPGTVTGLRVTETSPSGRVTGLAVVGTKGVITVGKLQVGPLVSTPSTKFVLGGGTALVAVGRGTATGASAPVPVVAGYVVTAGGVKAQVPVTGQLYLEGAGGTRVTGAAAAGEGLTLTGYGFGHGVGMSQWGAMGMAKAGKTYQEIIRHYYNGGEQDGRLRLAGNWGR
ncbi:MAG: SpoIID/LytB domain-containing protein [Heliobacteriaceae bacterium]|nr:SpoIID/LytB domain-containing protein [Heliobacteriaceae bacterium]